MAFINSPDDRYRYRKQTGVFTVELILVLPALMMFLIFITDMVTKQSIQSHLQQLSYSGVNIIKERRQLYSRDQNITSSQTNELFTLITQSMKRTQSGFNESYLGIHLEQVQFKTSDLTQPSLQVFTKGIDCIPGQPLDKNKKLFLKTKKNNAVALYRVNLCYHTENLMGRLVSENLTMVRASSMMIGR